MNPPAAGGHSGGLIAAPTLRTPDDRELVLRFVATREEEAFRALYRVHTPYLWKLALRLSAGNEPEAEEVVQEAWIRIAGRLERFAWRSALRTWLAGFVVHCWRERQKRARWTDELPSEFGSDDAIPQSVDRVDLERAIARHPAAPRSVLVLYEIEGFTHEEIGRLLGIPAGTSKSRLFTARRTLRQLLTDEGATP